MATPGIVRSASEGAEALLDRILCVCGAVIFSQLPEFMQQYLQRLEGHMDEAALQVDHFRDAAARSGMTLDQLAAGAAQNPDPAMARLGAVVRMTMGRLDELRAADVALRGASVWSRPFLFLRHLDWGIARATWAIYRPAVPTTAEGFIYAGLGMLAFLLAYYLGIKAPVARHFRERSLARAAAARPPA